MAVSVARSCFPVEPATPNALPPPIRHASRASGVSYTRTEPEATTVRPRAAAHAPPRRRSRTGSSIDASPPVTPASAAERA